MTALNNLMSTGVNISLCYKTCLISRQITLLQVSPTHGGGLLVVVARLAEATTRQLKTSTPGAEPLHLPCSLPSGRERGQRAARADAHTIHGRRSHNTNIFCKWEWETSPDLHSLILFAGDIEQNPGPPTYPCPVCHRAYSRRRGAVQCTVCQQWLCLSQHCSGISRIRHYTPGWICQGASPQHNP